MAHHKLAPDVAGEIGEDAQLDRSVHPPRVLRFSYVIDNWLGDDLLEAYPAFLVTDLLVAPLTGSGLSGFEVREAEIEVDDEAREMLTLIDRPELPDFHWLHVVGQAGRDDFGLTSTDVLVVSDGALEVLRRGRLDRCDVEEYLP